MLICLLAFAAGRFINSKTQVDSAYKIEKIAKISLISVTILTSL